MGSLYHRIIASDGFIDYGKNFCSNVNVLCHRLKRGEHFVTRNGRLEVRRHKSLCAKIKYFFTRKKEEAAVKSKISDTVIKLKGNDAAFRTLFFDRLARLPLQIFDRKATITKETAALLYPKLLEKNCSKVARRVHKTFFALKLGIDLKPISKGASGSYFARDYKGKIIGVFKPCCEESLGSNSPKLLTRIRHFFLKTLFRIDTSLPFWPREGYLAEVMSSKLASALGIEILPSSLVVKFKGKEGSFQQFVKNTHSAQEVLKLNHNCIKQEQFEQMALIDMATSNRDRHFENILVDENQNIALIDHALSFPRVNPSKSDYLYARNQNKWASLPNSAHPFSSQLINRAEKIFRGEGLKRLLDDLKEVNDLHGKGLSTKTQEGSSQEYAFKVRVATLLIGMINKMTIRQLARMKAKEDLNKFLHKHGINNEKKLDQFLEI